MNSSTWKRTRGCRSTRRTACTARPATSRTRRRTSSGSPQKVAAGPTIRTCDMDRRRALSFLALAALSPAASAQGGKVRRIGFISGAFASLYYDAFRAGMADLGYIEGKTAVFHTRFGEDLDDLAAALVNERPDLIVAAGGGAVRAVRKVAHSLPV